MEPPGFAALGDFGSSTHGSPRAGFDGFSADVGTPSHDNFAFGGSSRVASQSTQDGLDMLRGPLDVESQITMLDQKEMEVHQTQLRLIRKQVTVLTGDFLVLQKDVARLKSFMSSCESLQRSQASVISTKVREMKEALDFEREDRGASQNDLHNRIVGLEQRMSKGLPQGEGESSDVQALRAQVEQMRDRLSSARFATEDFVAKEKMDRMRHQEGFRDKLEATQRSVQALEELLQKEVQDKAKATQRSVQALEELLQKEVQDRAKEAKLLWEGLDSHTHDLDSKIVEELATSVHRQELAAGAQRVQACIELPPRSVPSRAASPAPAAAYAWRITEQPLQPEGPAVARAVQPTMLPPTATVRQVAAASPPPLRGALAGAPALSTAASTSALSGFGAHSAGPPSLSASTASLHGWPSPRS